MAGIARDRHVACGSCSVAMLDAGILSAHNTQCVFPLVLDHQVKKVT
jgi:hypothetical protein